MSSVEWSGYHLRAHQVITSGSTDPVDLDIPLEDDLHNLHQGHLDALQRCSKEQRDAHTNDKKSWEDERRAFEGARVTEVEALKRAHAAEARAASVKHAEEKTQSFQDGFDAGITARIKEDQEMVASLEKNPADAQRHVADLQVDLKAVRFRKECLALEQQMKRLIGEVKLQQLAGSKAATMGSSSGATPPEDADAAKLIDARIAMLEQDLQIERAARAKERELQQRRLAYETARHTYYKNMYQESQRVLGTSQGKPDMVVVKAGKDKDAALQGPGDGPKRTKATIFKCTFKPTTRRVLHGTGDVRAHPGCEPRGPAADVHRGAEQRSVLGDISANVQRNKPANGQQMKRRSPEGPENGGPEKLPVKLRRCNQGHDAAGVARCTRSRAMEVTRCQLPVTSDAGASCSVSSSSL